MLRFQFFYCHTAKYPNISLVFLKMASDIMRQDTAPLRCGDKFMLLMAFLAETSSLLYLISLEILTSLPWLPTPSTTRR